MKVVMFSYTITFAILFILGIGYYIDYHKVRKGEKNNKK